MDSCLIIDDGGSTVLAGLVGAQPFKSNVQEPDEFKDDTLSFIPWDKKATFWSVHFLLPPSYFQERSL